MNNDEFEEGGWCPECKSGVLEIYSEDGCTCFIVAPCSSCINAILKCDKCGWDTDDEIVVIDGSRVMEFI